MTDAGSFLAAMDSGLELTAADAGPFLAASDYCLELAVTGTGSFLAAGDYCIGPAAADEGCFQASVYKIRLPVWSFLSLSASLKSEFRKFPIPAFPHFHLPPHLIPSKKRL